MKMALGARSGKPISRRKLLTTAGSGVAGAALLRMAPWEAAAAPAQIKGTTLRILSWNHFVPDYDTYFDKFAADWGKGNGVTGVSLLISVGRVGGKSPDQRTSVEDPKTLSTWRRSPRLMETLRKVSTVCPSVTVRLKRSSLFGSVL